MIKNLTDAFEHINSKYIYNGDNYPVMKKLSENENVIFSINHGLLHVLKSRRSIGLDIPYEKEGIRKLQWLAQPDEKLGNEALKAKTATLKMVVNILSLANTAGITKEDLDTMSIPTDGQMVALIPIRQLSNPIVPTFIDAIDYLIDKLAVILEKADHENNIDVSEVFRIIMPIVFATKYWFDDFWVPDFLNQIPNVMKSK